MGHPPQPASPARSASASSSPTGTPKTPPAARLRAVAAGWEGNVAPASPALSWPSCMTHRPRCGIFFGIFRARSRCLPLFTQQFRRCTPRRALGIIDSFCVRSLADFAPSTALGLLPPARFAPPPPVEQVPARRHCQVDDHGEPGYLVGRRRLVGGGVWGGGCADGGQHVTAPPPTFVRGTASRTTTRPPSRGSGGRFASSRAADTSTGSCGLHVLRNREARHREIGHALLGHLLQDRRATRRGSILAADAGEVVTGTGVVVRRDRRRRGAAGRESSADGEAENDCKNVGDAGHDCTSLTAAAIRQSLASTLASQSRNSPASPQAVDQEFGQRQTRWPVAST